MPPKIDYQRIVEEIQTAITSDALVPETTLNELAADYLVACEEANQRLRECADLLRKGLRGEAIQRAELEPNLLDLVAMLDFAERAAWCDWLRQTERAVPPALSLDVAADLNTAYAEEQPLASMMKRHRLLALARAPLRDRIGVLREIAAADAANAVWGDDLRQYEQERLKQLRAEINAAAKADDAGALLSLEKELRDTGWLERPAAALLDRVIESSTRLRARQAKEEMRQLEPHLTAAFADFDVDRARPLRSRWKALQMLAALPQNDPLCDLVSPALEWVDEQDRRDLAEADFGQALADLETGLDDNLSRHDLDRLYHRLVACDRGVPEITDRRYHERIASLTVTEARRNKLLVAGLSLAAATAAAGVWLWIGHQLRETEVAEAAASLQALLDEAKVAEAGQFFAGITRDRPWLDNRAEIAELHSRLDGMVKAENDRRAAFDTTLASARAAGVDRPDRTAIDEARRLAATSKEKAEVAKFERQIAKRQRELQDERNAAFTARVEALRKQIDELEKDDSEDFEKRLEAIKRVDGEAQALVSGAAGGADPALVSNAKTLRARLQALADTAQGLIAQRRYLQELNASVGSRSRFRTRLGAYINRFPGGKRSADFQKVLDASPTVDDQIQKWNALLADFAKLDIQKMSADSAAARIAEGRALIDIWRSDPRAALVQARLAALEPIARRVSGGARIEAPLTELFRLPTISGLKIVKAKRGNYYADEDPTVYPKNDRIRVSFLKDFKLSKDYVYLKKAELASDNAIGEAPQSTAARAVLRELQFLTDGHWEAAFCRMVAAIDKDRDLDPILKAQLLLQVLSVARTGSLVLEHAFARHAQQLTDSAPDAATNWLDPTDTGAARVRAMTKELLDALPGLRDAQDAAVKEYAALRKAWPTTEYRWVGWLMQDEEGRWRCASQPLPEDWSAELLLMGETADKPPTMELTALGRIEKGRATVNGASPLLVEGRSVYAAFVAEK